MIRVLNRYLGTDTHRLYNLRTKMSSAGMENFLLLTYDSCRYDVLASANTPVLDSYSRIYCAEAPANFTFASHQAFFVGILPYVKEFVPYYNRFKKQLLGLAGVGESQVSKMAYKKTESN